MTSAGPLRDDNLPRGGRSFVTIVVLLAIVLAMRHVPTAIDDVNYLEYFSGHSLALYWRRIELAYSNGVFSAMLVACFQEGLWALGADVLSLFLNPIQCIQVLVFVVNFGVLFAARDQKCPWFFLAAWALLPMGAVGMGYNQLRQGLALALLLNLRRFPVVAFLVSLGIHRSSVIAGIHPWFLVGWRRPLLLIPGILMAFFAFGTLFVDAASRETADNLLVHSLNINWLLIMSMMFILHVAMILDPTLSKSAKWLLKISTIITGLAIIGFFAAPFLTGRYYYYSFLLFAFASSDVVRIKIREMRALTGGCVVIFAFILCYQFLRFTVDADIFTSFKSLLF